MKLLFIILAIFNYMYYCDKNNVRHILIEDISGIISNNETEYISNYTYEWLIKGNIFIYIYNLFIFINNAILIHFIL